ncbi:hypothetical protein QBC43DRAFT_104565 [Cladorrhinum sp. PSN259]|nr:hypothetical protein QBC43DRAFT_104565 [Cladorrhinum sp. PSN259]
MQAPAIPERQISNPWISRPIGRQRFLYPHHLEGQLEDGQLSFRHGYTQTNLGPLFLRITPAGLLKKRGLFCMLGFRKLLPPNSKPFVDAKAPILKVYLPGTPCHGLLLQYIKRRVKKVSGSSAHARSRDRYQGNMASFGVEASTLEGFVWAVWVEWPTTLPYPSVRVTLPPVKMRAFRSSPKAVNMGIQAGYSQAIRMQMEPPSVRSDQSL